VERGQFLDAVRAAILAPSMLNAQPWRFRHRDGCVEVYEDRDRRLPVADPDGWAARVACGAAAANAALALAAAGVQTATELVPDPQQPRLLARIRPVSARVATPSEWALARAIPRRHSNRRPFADTPVPPQAQVAMDAAAVEHGARLRLLTERAAVEQLAEIVNFAEHQLHEDPAYVAELRRATAAPGVPGTGVPGYVAGLAPEPQDLLPMRDFGGVQRGRFVDFEEHPLVAVLSTTGATVHDDLVAGIALQYVLLTATTHELAVSMLSQAIEVPAARERLRHLPGGSGVPQLVLRIGFGQPTFVSPRRPIEEVIDD
jgi:hypothetical protein